MNVYLCTKAENLSPGQPKYLSRYVDFWRHHINLCTTEAGPPTLIMCSGNLCGNFGNSGGGGWGG